MKNILKKINLIMKEVDFIKKDASVNFGKTNYDYASEKVIKEVFHNAFVKHGIVFQLETSTVRVENNNYMQDCVYHFFDVDTGEELKGTFVGSGQGRDEKGIYAGVTGAIKYILTSTFLVPTGDDPERDASPAVSEAEYSKAKDIQIVFAQCKDTEELEEKAKELKNEITKLPQALQSELKTDYLEHKKKLERLGGR